MKKYTLITLGLALFSATQVDALSVPSQSMYKPATSNNQLKARITQLKAELAGSTQELKKHTDRYKKDVARHNKKVSDDRAMTQKRMQDALKHINQRSQETHESMKRAYEQGRKGLTEKQKRLKDTITTLEKQLSGVVTTQPVDPTYTPNATQSQSKPVKTMPEWAQRSAKRYEERIKELSKKNGSKKRIAQWKKACKTQRTI